jgi:predicted small secreted protein
MIGINRIVFIALLAAFGLAACENTVRGVGRDVQETGQAVEDTVEGNP